MIQARRAYETPDPRDGYRVLIDRLWPRGVTKEALAIDRWAKELAPSDALRRWFGHDPGRFEEFARRYREELRAPAARALLDDLARRAARGRVTIVFGARDAEHSNAPVVVEEVRRRLRAAARPRTARRPAAARRPARRAS